MASLTPDRVANLLERLKACDVEASNLLSAGFAGPMPEAADSGRRMYLTWHARVEQLMLSAEAPPAEIASLQTPRHRELVRNQVTMDQAYREVELELGFVQSVLANTRRRLEEFAQPPGSALALDGVQRFRSDRGREYSYNPQGPIGHGGLLTKVYRGSDAAGDPVAVKQVRIRLDTSGRRRAEPRLAEREIEIARQLRDAHGEHLVPVLDYAHRDGELLLVMPLADRSLADQIMESGRLDSHEVKAVLLDIAQAMQELAVAGVLHRDIKPGNVLRYRERWCLGDFGISKIVDTAMESVSWVGSGTPEYRAPELFDGKPETQLSDEYALGLTALEALTGQRAISGNDLRQAHATLVPEFPDGTDPLVQRVVTELLHKDPGGRPSDPRRINDLLMPADSLSSIQIDLQRIRARKAKRDLELSAHIATVRERSDLQRQARVSFEMLWSSVGEYAMQAVDDAKVICDGNMFTLEVGDTEMRAHVAHEAPSRDGELVLVVDVYVQPNAETGLIANLVCTRDDDLLRWRIFQFTDDASGRPYGIEAPTFFEAWEVLCEGGDAGKIVDATVETIVALLVALTMEDGAES